MAAGLHGQSDLVVVSDSSALLIYDVVNANAFAVESTIVPILICPVAAGPPGAGVPAPAPWPLVRESAWGPPTVR